jgi:gamma-glutamylaminecyclotransferase
MTARSTTRDTRETSSRSAKREPDARTRVFVYGTLLSGERNHHLLARARLVGEARTGPRFSLYDLGSFPGLVPNGGHAVAGEVYEVDEPTLAALDRLEGHPDFYRRASVVLDDGTSVQAYLLTLEHVRAHPIIASGSWRTR